MTDDRSTESDSSTWWCARECAAPAEVVDRFALPSTDGPVEHVKVQCLGRHWFVLPAAALAPVRTVSRDRPRRGRSDDREPHPPRPRDPGAPWRAAPPSCWSARNPTCSSTAGAAATSSRPAASPTPASSPAPARATPGQRVPARLTAAGHLELLAG